MICPNCKKFIPDDSKIVENCKILVYTYNHKNKRRFKKWQIIQMKKKSQFIKNGGFG